MRPLKHLTPRHPRSILRVIFAVATIPACAGAAASAQEAEDAAQIWEHDFRTDRAQQILVLPSVSDCGELAYNTVARRFAFAAIGQGDRKQRTHVFCCGHDGTGFRDLGPGTQPAWSPRGRRLLVLRQAPEAGIWLLVPDTGEELLIDENASAPAWSPDGGIIAFSRIENGAAKIVLHNLIEDDFQAIPLPANAGFARITSLAWNPEKSGLLVHGEAKSGPQLAYLDLSQAPSVSIEVLSTGMGVLGRPCFAGSQRIVVCRPSPTHDAPRLFAGALSADTDEVRDRFSLLELSGHPQQRHIVAVDAAPQLERIYFVSQRP